MAAPLCPNCNQRAGVAPVANEWLCPRCNRTFRPVKPARSRAGFAASTRARSSRQERHNARAVGGYLTANSGAGHDKGDIKVRGLLREEDKTTTKRSYVLRLDDLVRVSAAAVGDEIPILRISFEDNLAQQYVVMPSEWFQQLLEHFRESE